MNAEPTPGPWFWDVNPKSKSLSLRAPQKGGTIVMDFVRYGMGSAQPRFRVSSVMHNAADLSVVDPERDHHKDWHRLLEHPDARLIAAAPELLSACISALERLKEIEEEYPCNRSITALRNAIAKALTPAPL